jgi:hypothetical protein
MALAEIKKPGIIPAFLFPVFAAQDDNISVSFIPVK